MIHIAPKKLVGIHTTMSLVDNATAHLWQTFMPRRHEVKHRVSTDYISMQVYTEMEPGMFSPTTTFEKWAVVEVAALEDIPQGMAGYTLEGGMYAVFDHKGPASHAPKVMRYIFGEWLPASEFELDHREHFEVLPEGYDPMDSNAEEEIWVPVRKQSV